MKRLRMNGALGLVGVLALSVASCAASPAPRELVDARAAYQRAQTGAALKFKPDQVHEAKTALDIAEQSFTNDPDAQKTRDLAYVAQRKAELAEANAASDQALAAKAKADEDARTATAGQLAQTRSQLAVADKQLATTGQALAGTKEQLEAEKKARADADKRAKDAMDRLAAASIGSVKQEPRGMVITLSGSVLFASNKDTLLPAAQDKLTQVAEALKTQEDNKIVVEGHTDSQGTEASNQALSERRAQAVVSFLTSRGVPADKIRAQGLGQGRPIADNASPEGRANNRRVEIVIQPVERR